MSSETIERRSHQRIVTSQSGGARFWLNWPGGRVALGDLSVDGFAMSLSSPPPSQSPFAFVLEREGSAQQAQGSAQVVNYVSAIDGGQAGCRFVELGAEARAQITAWLAEHVVAVAAVPLSSADAERIVLGPSIV